MRIHNRLVANGKFPAVSNGINEFQVRPVPAYIESHELDREFTMEFDFKSLQEWHKICMDKSYLDKPIIPVDDMQKFYKQLKTFCNNAVLLSSKNFEDRPLTIQIYDLNSQAIRAIRMCLFHLEFFANIQVVSSTIQNTNNHNMSLEGSVIDSTLEICKACNKNDTNYRLVHNKTLTLAQIKLLSDNNTHKKSRRNFSFFSNMYKQLKTIGLNKIDKMRMRSGSSSQNLLEIARKKDSDDYIIRRNLIVKIDVNNSWVLLEKVLRYSVMREIPVVAVFNLQLDGTYSNDVETFLEDKGLHFVCHYANLSYTINSHVLIFYESRPDLNFHLVRSRRFAPSMNEINNFLMVNIDFNQSRFQLITVNTSKMSEQNEEKLYLRMNRVVSNKPTILIVQSPNGRFHTQCADGDLVLQLANDELLSQLEYTNGTLVYITKEFPKDISDIEVFTGSMMYKRSEVHNIDLEAALVIVSIPLNQ